MSALPFSTCSDCYYLLVSREGISFEGAGLLATRLDKYVLKVDVQQFRISSFIGPEIYVGLNSN